MLLYSNHLFYLDRCLVVVEEDGLSGTAVGCANHENYANNPLHKLHLTKASHVMIRLQMTSLQSQISTCLVVKSDATNKTVAKTNNGVYTNKICGVKTIEFTVEEGTYSLISGVVFCCFGFF